MTINVNARMELIWTRVRISAPPPKKEVTLKLQTGDIILSSKESIIVKFMRLFQKDPVFWGHVFIAKDSEFAWEAGRKLQEINIKKKLDKEPYWKIIRKIDLTEEQKNIMRKVAPHLIGRSFGIFRIFLQLLDHVSGTNWFTNQSDNKYLQVCSSYVAWIYWVACGYKFNGVSWQSCDPDDIEDNQMVNPDVWEIVTTY